jgi:hypothetical protein
MCIVIPVIRPLHPHGATFDDDIAKSVPSDDFRSKSLKEMAFMLVLSVPSLVMTSR